MKRIGVVVLLVACGSSGAELSDTPEATACDHFQAGANYEVSAAMTADTVGPALEEGLRVDVELLDGGAEGFVGFVGFDVALSAQWIIHLSEPSDMEILDEAGLDVPINATVTGSKMCGELQMWHVVDLSMGMHAVHFYGAEVPQLGVVVVPRLDLLSE